MFLTKQQLLERRVPSDAQPLTLPGGQTVRVLPVSAKLFREYRQSLRDQDGNLVPDRQACVDELLLARVLVDENSQRMFSDEDVLAGCFDHFMPLDFDALMDWAWSFISTGDREKKYSPTTSGEPACESPAPRASRHR